MESKNVKIIDEHNIDRDANIVCAFSVDHTDYVLYWIERDEDNANLFVSKLLKNNDNTSNMMNIEDSMEKNKITDIVKELVTISVKSDNDKSANEVVLNNGDKVILSSVLFNRDQSINVTKTYVSTVKKAVAKASENYYENSKEEKNNDNEIFNDIFVNTKEEKNDDNMVMPEVEETPVEPVLDSPVNTDDVMNSFVDNLNIEQTPVEEKKEDVSNQPEPISTLPTAPVEPAALPVETPLAVSQPAVEQSNNVTEPVVSFVTPQPQSVTPVVANVSAASVQQPEPIVEVEKKAEEPLPPVLEKVTPVTAMPVQEPKLVFDASHETNLNNALNNESANNTTTVNDVSPLRSFGQSDVVNNVNNNNLTNLVTPAEVSQISQVPKVASRGFANFKIIAIIGLIIFAVACAFMGYEIYNYFIAVK